MSGPAGRRGPILLCYDGSDHAKRAIEDSAPLLGGGEALALTAFESVGSALLRHRPVHETELGREFKEISEDVVGELDSGAAERAEAKAAQGAEVAGAVGFEARPLAHRALARTAERDTTTIWRAILDIADDHDCAVVVVGARGMSGIGSALLGSVSYGLLHNSRRPVLVIPPRD
jgi:nucleotide-binding universal stress UspA family protein